MKESPTLPPLSVPDPNKALERPQLTHGMRLILSNPKAYVRLRAGEVGEVPRPVKFKGQVANNMIDLGEQLAWRTSQRCRHGTQSCAHELYDRTPRTLSSAIKWGIQGPGREHGGGMASPLKRRPTVELCANGTRRSPTTPGHGR